jgi:hypothetical protein
VVPALPLLHLLDAVLRHLEHLGTHRNLGIDGMPLSYKGIVSQNLGAHRNLGILGMPFFHKGLVSQNLGTHRNLGILGTHGTFL